MESSANLLTVHDLAHRWGVSTAKVKRHVRRRNVPFIQIDTDADMRINWTTVRFRLAAIEQWEEESTRVFDEAGPAKAPAASTGARHKLTRIR